jgi:hypothetical protein
MMSDSSHLAYVLHGRFLVEVIRFSFDDVQRVFGTVADAGPESVTKHIPHDPGLAVDDGQSAFSASGYALAAACAFVFVYFNDFSFHAFLRCLLRESCLWALGYDRFEPCQKWAQK